MGSLKHKRLRTIAEHELRERLGEMDPRGVNDLVTSLVRQWLTCEGHAVIVTGTHDLWFRIRDQPGGTAEVVCDKKPNRVLNVLRVWGVDTRKASGLLHQVNVRQIADCVNADGRRLTLRMDPTERLLTVQDATDL